MSAEKRVTTPLTEDTVKGLQAGDRVLITGVVYTARDAAHKRMVQMHKDGERLPFDLEGQIIYYVGPCPAKPGHVIGPCGPTTSFRMDAYTPAVLELGLKGMIGKGQRAQTVKDAMVKNKAVYFASIGGAAAVIARTVKKAEVVGFEDFGPEAIYKLDVVDFPCIVVTDAQGADLYDIGVRQYRIG
jgi:fumarate hydratase subunit beta